MQTLASVNHALRAALRQHVLGLVDIDRSPAEAVSLANGVFIRAGGSWLDDGFALGQELTVAGWGAEQIGQVAGLEPLRLTLADVAGSGDGAQPRFRARLPQSIAWEGSPTFYPAPGRPFVAEVLQSASKTLLSIANGATRTIEHRWLASFSFNYPAERGTLALERMTGAALAHFAPGSAWGGPAVIQGGSLSPLLRDGAWIGQAVSIELLAFTTD